MTRGRPMPPTGPWNLPHLPCALVNKAIITLGFLIKVNGLYTTGVCSYMQIKRNSFLFGYQNITELHHWLSLLLVISQKTNEKIKQHLLSRIQTNSTFVRRTSDIAVNTDYGKRFPGLSGTFVT